MRIAGKQKFPAVCEPNPKNMKNYLIVAVVASLAFACERKEVTINPPGETKETTIITPAPAAPATPEKKTETTTETETTITPGGTTTETTETIEEK